MERERVFALINQERERQDLLWGGSNHDKYHELGSWLTFIRYYLRLAEESVASTKYDDSEALRSVRKIAALSVAAMEYLYDD